MWERNGQDAEVALFVRSLVAAEARDAPVAARTLVRQQQEALGLSLARAGANCGGGSIPSRQRLGSRRLLGRCRFGTGCASSGDGLAWPELEQGLAKFLRGEVPTLLVAADWAQNHCVVPDGVHHGEWFLLRDWQLFSWLSWYQIKPGTAPAYSLGEDGHEVKPVSTFFYRRAQIVLPQKAGKAPYTSAKVCLRA
jgi:hypothetical protein